MPRLQTPSQVLTARVHLLLCFFLSPSTTSKTHQEKPEYLLFPGDTHPLQVRERLSTWMCFKISTFYGSKSSVLIFTHFSPHYCNFSKQFIVYITTCCSGCSATVGIHPPSAVFWWFGGVFSTFVQLSREFCRSRRKRRACSPGPWLHHRPGKGNTKGYFIHLRWGSLEGLVSIPHTAR